MATDEELRKGMTAILKGQREAPKAAGGGEGGMAGKPHGQQKKPRYSNAGPGRAGATKPGATAAARTESRKEGEKAHGFKHGTGGRKGGHAGNQWKRDHKSHSPNAHPDGRREKENTKFAGAKRKRDGTQVSAGPGALKSGTLSDSLNIAACEDCLRRLSNSPSVMSGKCKSLEGNWYTVYDLLDRPFGSTGSVRATMIQAPPAGLISRFRDLAERVLAAEVEAFEKKRATSSSAEIKWMRTVLATGTQSDRLAAMTLMLQESPVHSLKHLDSLLALARKRGRRESQQVIEALRDLFITNLLPPHRKLVPFEARAFHAAERINAEHLVYWIFEDSLKARYAQFVNVLQEHLGDAISHFKASATKTVFDLLAERPEQEAALLAVLVNKLGDPEGKLASKAQYLLSQLVNKHEAMKPVVVREVRQFLIRPHLSPQAQYFAAIFLNQLTLSAAMPQLASDLISTYLSSFEVCVQRGEMNTKLLAALLTGLNRAYPYVRDADVGAQIEKHADTLFNVVHKANFNTALQALALLQHLAAKSSAVAAGSPTEDKFADRYYRALYSKMTVGDLENCSKQTLFLNLLFKSLKADLCGERVKAMLKRLVQVALYMPANFAAGIVYLTAELVRLHPAVRSMVTQPEHSPNLADDALPPKDATASEAQAEKVPRNYDPWKREPRYAGAEFACLWELTPLALHYHPSVRKFADYVLSSPGLVLAYKGDPLVDFTLPAFLDRYVYKNPKALQREEQVKGVDLKDDLALGYAVAQGYDPAALKAIASGKTHGLSQMQPARPRHGRADTELPATSSAFASLSAAEVAPEDMFLHSYFKTKQQGELIAPRKKQRRDTNVDLEDAEEDMFADKIAEELLRTAGGGLDGEDDDFGFDDDASDRVASEGEAEGKMDDEAEPDTDDAALAYALVGDELHHDSNEKQRLYTDADTFEAEHEAFPAAKRPRRGKNRGI